VIIVALLLYVIFHKIHARVGGFGCTKQSLSQINTHPIIQLCTVVVQFKLLDLKLFALFLHVFCKEKRPVFFDRPCAALHTRRGMLKAGCADPIKNESMTNKEKQSVNKL
jgi:hypothetical protein